MQVSGVTDIDTASNNNSAAEELVSRLQVLEVVSSALHHSLLPKVMPAVEQLCKLLCHPYKAVRHLAARCMATLAALDTATVMTSVIQNLLPQLEAPDSVIRRQGAVECLACVADKLEIKMVPYIVLFIVPLLGKCCDNTIVENTIIVITGITGMLLS